MRVFESLQEESVDELSVFQKVPERGMKESINENSCRRGLESTGLNIKGKSCTARPLEKWRHAVSKLRRGVSMTISMADRKEATVLRNMRRR